MTIEKIIDCLKYRAEKLEYIQKRRQQIVEEWQDTEQESIQSAAYPAGMVDERVGNLVHYRKGKLPEDMLKVLERAKKLEIVQQESLLEEAYSLNDQEEEIQLVYTALRVLPEAFYNLLMDLYVCKETWESVSVRKNISRSTISKIRQKALEALSELCDRFTEEELKEMYLKGKRYPADFRGGWKDDYWN